MTAARPAGPAAAGMHSDIRRTLTLLALAPVTLILAVKVTDLVGDPVLNAYGIAVLVATLAVIYLAFTHYDDPSVGEGRSEARGSSDAQPVVSCIVAVRDEMGQIEACVRSILDSTYEPKEVIVVDDASTDATVDVLRRLESRLAEDQHLGGRALQAGRYGLRFRLILLPSNVGKKRALIEGVKAARGELLVFTDSDCLLAPTAIERCVDALMLHSDIGAVSGHARALNASHNVLTRIQDVWYDGQFGVQKAAESVFGSVTCVSGPLAVFRRCAIYNYLPAWANDRFVGREFRFATDRQLTGYVLGQQWIGRSLKERYAEDPFVRDVDYPERRWRVEYVRSARVLTNVPSSVRGFLRQQVRWKKSFIRNIFFTGTFQWRRGLGPAALFYLHLLFVIAAPFLAFRHLIWLPLHGVWILTLLYLCGVFLKGGIWALAYKAQNPTSRDWVYRPFMSLISVLVLSWLLVYSASTLRNNIWWRG